MTLSELPVQVDVLRGTGKLRWADTLQLELNDLRLAGSAFEQKLEAAVDGLVLSEADVRLLGATATNEEGARLELAGLLGFDGTLELEVSAAQLPLALADPGLDGSG